MSSATVHNLKNDTRLEEFEAFVREKGRESAQGKDALPSFAIGFVRAVYDQVVDLNKDAAGDDASSRYFKKYAAAEGKKAFHDRSQASQKSQVSKVKQLEKAASNPKCDFVDVLNRTVTIYQQAHKDGIPLKSPFPAYVDVAREQNKCDDDLTDDVIYSTVCKSDKEKEVTLEGELKKVAKKLEDIISGEKWPGIMDQSAEVIAASEAINQRIKTLLLEKDKQAVIDKAAELGMEFKDDDAEELAALDNDTSGEVYTTA